MANPNITNLTQALDRIELKKKTHKAPDSETSIWVKVDRITTVTFKNTKDTKEHIEHFLRKYYKKTLQDVEIRINNKLVEL